MRSRRRARSARRRVRAPARAGFEKGKSRICSSVRTGEERSTRSPGRLITDSDSDAHDEPARLRRGQPDFEGVELLDGAGMVAGQAANADRAVEAPARARRP